MRLTKLRTYLRGINRLEILTWATGLVGWLLVTWGIMELTGSAWVWKLSAGLLLLGLFGYGTLWELFRAGILGLSQGVTDDRDSNEGGT